MALSGILRAHEDDAARALVHDLSPEVEQQLRAPLRLRTGSGSGLIVASTTDCRPEDLLIASISVLPRLNGRFGKRSTAAVGRFLLFSIRL
jgi:hypothetical protein